MLQAKSTQKVLLDLHYLPSIPYCQAIMQHQELLLDTHSFYQKQSYQSRTHIRNAQGMQRLIVPVKHPRIGVPYRNMHIDYSTPWVQEHQRGLQAAYNSTPYGEILLEEMILPVLSSRPTLLLDLSLQLLQRIFFFIGIKPAISIWESRTPTPDIVDMRGLFHPKKPLIEQYSHTPYTQRFTPFIPNLSVVDLLACEGREIVKMIK